MEINVGDLMKKTIIAYHCQRWTWGTGSDSILFSFKGHEKGIHVMFINSKMFNIVQSKNQEKEEEKKRFVFLYDPYFQVVQRKCGLFQPFANSLVATSCALN